jgi:hypothetical protein
MRHVAITNRGWKRMAAFDPLRTLAVGLQWRHAEAHEDGLCGGSNPCAQHDRRSHRLIRGYDIFARSEVHRHRPCQSNSCHVSGHYCSRIRRRGHRRRGTMVEMARLEQVTTAFHPKLP